MTMRVAMLAAECEPWAKTGGLADVVDALARALGRLPEAGTELDTPVDVFLPRYRSVPVPAAAVTEPVLSIPDPDLGRRGATIDVSIVDVAADGYRLRLVDVPAAFDRDAFYDYPDDPWRFAVFCRAALAALRRDGRPRRRAPRPRLAHRPRAPRTRPSRRGGRRVPRADRGRAPRSTTSPTTAGRASSSIDQLGLRAGEPLAGDNPDGVDLLLTAIERSEIANTVSPGFAREALTPEFGMGLDGALRAKGNRFIGILNGIDPDVWDPANDPALAAPFSRRTPAGKAACRRDLLTRAGFDPDDDGVVLGMIGRMDPQKGFDLLADAMPALLAGGARVVVQGSGHASLADPFRALAAARPAQVALIERFDRDMARRIYAGADLFLMPSRFEPSGQGQMIALRYGTPPVVRRTGGLADSVVDVDRAARRGHRLRVRRGDADGAGRGDRAGGDACARPTRRRGRPSATGAWPSTSAGTPAPRRATSRRTGARSPSGEARPERPDPAPRRSHGSAPSGRARIRSRPIPRATPQPGGPDAQAVRRPGQQPARPAGEPRRADGRARRRPAGDRRRRHRRPRPHDHDHGGRRHRARRSSRTAAGPTSRASRCWSRSTTGRAAWPGSPASSPTRASTSTATCSWGAGATARRSRSSSTTPRRRGRSWSVADARRPPRIGQNRWCVRTT